MENQAECNLLDHLMSLKTKGYYTAVSFNSDGMITISIWFNGSPLDSKMDIWLCIDSTEDASEAIDRVQNSIEEKLKNKYEVA